MNESMVIVDIEDTGTGISEDEIKRIYDPFFTTKGVSRGTASADDKLRNHPGARGKDPGGQRTGKGTRFRLKLPTRQPITR